MHLGTRVLHFDHDDRCSGQTLWGVPWPHGAAGLAWDWVEIRAGVVAMADPMSVVTNLRLLDCHGEALTMMQVTVQLHQWVHALPWQSEVTRALHAAT